MVATTKKPRLLLIEDNPDTRQIYKDVFERDGFEVLQAEDGEKGLSYAQASLPDVILLDLMLPKLSGFDLLQRLRAQEDTQRIPVMIFSALGDAADRRKAAELGVTEYSMKASNPPKQVLSRVRALLASVERPAVNVAAPALFAVALHESFFDVKVLQAQTGFMHGFLCPQCNAKVVLSMIVDPTRTPGHWFAAHLVCSGCRRTF
jgi:DNA-binding response OmpR family regulator